MMRAAIFVFLVASWATGSKAQECIPDPVYDLALDSETLTWGPSTNCPTTHYIVNIHSSGVLEYVYQVDNTALNVTFLSYCRPYTFTVTAMSDHIIGLESTYSATIGLPDDDKITISNFTGSQIDRDVLFQWHIPVDYLYCAESYNMLIWDEDSTEPIEVTTYQTGYFVNNVSQCMNYTVQLSAKYGDTEQPVAEFSYTVPPKPNDPILEAVRQDATTINTTWALESYSLNRCPVSTLYVNSSRFIAILPILDIPARPTIDVTIPGLRADSMYYFNVTIENSAGNSSAYQMAVQTLPVEEYSNLYLDNTEDFEEIERFDNH